MPTVRFVGPPPPLDRLSVARVDFPGTYLADLVPDGQVPDNLTVGVVCFEVAQDLTPMEFEAFLATDERSWGLCIRSQSRPSSRGKPANMLLVVDGKLPIWAAARLGTHFWRRRSQQRDGQIRHALAFRTLHPVPWTARPGGMPTTLGGLRSEYRHDVAVVVGVDGEGMAMWRAGNVVPLPWKSKTDPGRTPRFDEAQSNRLLVYEAASGHFAPSRRGHHAASSESADYVLRFEPATKGLVSPARFGMALDDCLRGAHVVGVHVVLDGAMATWMAAWASARLLETGARVVSVRDVNGGVERLVRCECGNYPSGGVAVLVGRRSVQQSSNETSDKSIVPFPSAPVGGHVVLLSGDPDVGKSTLAPGLERALIRRVPGRSVRLARRINLNPDGEGLWARETSEALRDVARRAQPFFDAAIATWLTRAMAARRQFRVVVGDLGGRIGNDTIRAAELATAVVHIEHATDDAPEWPAEAWKALAPTSAVHVIRVSKRNGERVESELAVLTETHHGSGPTLAARVVELKGGREKKGRRSDEDVRDWTQRLAAFLYGAPLVWSRREETDLGGGWRAALQRLVQEALPSLRKRVQSSDRNTDPALLSALGAVTWHVASVCAWGAGSPPLGAPKEVLEACLDLAATPACIGLPADIGYDVARLAKAPGDGGCPDGLHAALVHFHESRLTSDRKELLLAWLGARVRTVSSAEE